MVGSLTGSGGDGGRPVGEDDAGGGIGRATGPGFLWQAATLISTTHKDKLTATCFPIVSFVSVSTSTSPAACCCQPS